MNRTVHRLRQGLRSIVLGLFFPHLLWCAGCAARLETANGSTWIVGLSRGSTHVRDFGEHEVVFQNEIQSAPLELRIMPHGFSLGLADAKHAEARVMDEHGRDQFVSRRDFGIPLGSGQCPWRFGLAYYRAPQPNARVSARVDTVHGLALRLAYKDSCLTAGASRTCVTELEDGDHDVLICYDISRRFPEIKITKPQPGD